MSPADVLAFVLLLSGCFFFFAGTVGILRFPDAYCRLHALTKADNVGLFFLCAGLGVYSGEWQTAAMLILIWMLNLLASTTSAHLIARHARREDEIASVNQAKGRDT